MTVQSQSRFTPGPWEAIIGDYGYIPGHGPYFGVDSPEGQLVLVLEQKKFWAPGSEREYPIAANARLIAAAPELLAQLVATTENLKALAEAFSERDSRFASLVEANVEGNRQIIAKATGE